jgi:hydrogenase-1 operon protein HyaF
VSGWVPATFGRREHATLRLALDGRHADVKCAACHGVDRTGLPPLPGVAAHGRAKLAIRLDRADCASCHVDVHAGRDAQGPRLAMDGIDSAALAVTNEVLGEGEVSIQVAGERRFRIQESVFTGVWRCLEVDAQGRLVQDWLEAAAMPQVVIDAARAASANGVAELAMPAGAMNSPALLAEIASELAGRSPGAPAHTINLTLLPMTPADHAMLERALPVGPVAIMSRAFGNCRVTSTSTRDVWRVQYFNTMNTLILNTIEVVELPESAIASAQDLLDTRTRLAELLEWMAESCAEPARPAA